MKTLYIECAMGAAGDMLTAALMELLPDPDGFVERMNRIGIPNMRMERSEKTTAGVRGTHISVHIGDAEEISDDVHPKDICAEHEHPHEHEHHHAGLTEIEGVVAKLALPDSVKKDVMGVYTLIAEAEAFAHGSEIEKIHFHEVGMMDAIADVSAVCLLMHLLAPKRVVVSPVCTGFGQVRCMHGVLPVPTPATAYLIRNMPVYAGGIRGELLTPTGAALLKYFADEFSQMPLMRIEKVGCGCGMKEFPAANCVRVILGEDGAEAETVVEICCNLDDMTGEALAFAAEMLLEKGALDVWTVPIQMKKGRMGAQLNCLCRSSDRDEMARLMLLHTTSLGVRMHTLERRTLRREFEEKATPYGQIRIKKAAGMDICKQKPEYEDCAQAARSHSVSLAEVTDSINKA